MKKARLALCSLGLLIVASGLRLASRSTISAPTLAHPQITASTHVPASAVAPSSATIAAASTAPPPSSPPAFMFSALSRSGTLLHKSTRQFTATPWEPELRKNLDLPTNVPLQRRSGLFRMPGGFLAPLIRIDRVYRTDRSAATVNGPLPNANSPAPFANSSPSPDPLDSDGGELLWENAMVADHLMVQTHPDVTQAQLQRALPAPCQIKSASSKSGLYLIAIPAEGERSIELAIAALSQLPQVQYAEPDHLIAGADTTPNDPLFGPSTTTQQWHLGKVMAPRAWNVITAPQTPTDAAGTVVAVVDTGIDYTHPDLAQNMWTNPGESGGGKETNGIDDDGNGKIDDHRGWDFIGQSTVKTTIQPDNDPMDDSGHGTHVAGIIGAVGNNSLGVSGVCWQVKLLPLRIIKKFGTGTYGTYSTAVAALNYIKELNSGGRQIAVANHSWGGSGYSLTMLNAINNPVVGPDPLPTGLTSTFIKGTNFITLTGTSTERSKVKIGMTITGTGIPSGTLITIIDATTTPSATSLYLSNYTTVARTSQVLTFSNPVRPKPYGLVHVAAAGNSRSNNDRLPTYPASLPSGFIISVGAVDTSDNAALWAGTAGSNYGRLTVDIFAPGSNIWSTKLKLTGESSYSYEARNGTSMAAPQVAGAVALLRLWQPEILDVQARQVLLDQADPIPALADKCISGGRLNVARIIDKVYQPVLVASGGATGGGATTITAALQAAMSISGRLAMGSAHALFVSQGEVWAWGDNTAGQLGNGTTTSSAIPIRVLGLSDITMVSIGYSYGTHGTSLALKADGTVWVWGANGNGRHANGSFSEPDWLTPRQITSLSDIVWIAANYDHCLAVRADGTVMAWGSNNSGQLGDGTLTARATPVQVSGASNVVQVSVGERHSLALRSDGTVHGWGSRGPPFSVGNALGDGPLTSAVTTAITIPDFSDIVYVDANSGSSFFLKADGTVWRAGKSLGSTSGGWTAPSLVPDLADITVLAAHRAHIIAIDSSGRAFAWGNNAHGEVGNTSTFYVLTPQEVLLPDGLGIIACAAGPLGTLALDLDGNLWTCGGNQYGQLGISKVPQKTIPIQVSGLSGVVSIGGAVQGTPSPNWSGLNWARFSDGTFRMTGNHSLDKTDFSRIYLQNLTLFPSTSTPVTELTLGALGWAALCSNGTVWTWGSAGAAALGPNRSSLNALIPTQVTGIPSTIVSIASGNAHVLAAADDGSLYAWGDNTSSEIGDGTTTQRRTPVLVSGINSVSQVCSNGGSFSVALKTDGSVWAWGQNSKGILGNGTFTGIATTPQQVPNVSNVIQILSTGASVLAVTASGGVIGWGNSLPNSAVAIPVYLPTSGKVVKCAVAGHSVIALLDNGTAVTWGSNESLLGRTPGSSAPAGTPTQVYGGSDIIDVAGGAAFWMLKSDGTAYSWGAENEYNAGGTGHGESWATSFVPVVGFSALSTTLSTLGTKTSDESWYFQNYSVAEILDVNLVADYADPDNDGIPNLLEYALGLNPRNRNVNALPTARAENLLPTTESTEAQNQVRLFSLPTADLSFNKRYMAFTVNRQGGKRADIDYIVEVSEDLITWRSGDPHTVTVLDTPEVLEVYSAASLDDAPRQFMRLKIQRK